MKVLRDKKIFDVISNVDIIEHLPVANYELKFGAFGRIFLEETDNVIIPEKVYSNDTDFIKHVLHTWENTKNVMGVGLVGKKGLGKSFTGNIIAQEAGVPIIRLLGVAPNSNLFGFLNKIEQDFVLFIDEFDAYYHHDLSKIIVKELKQTCAQVVLTTHNTSIMTNDLLRPDCYFVMTDELIKPLCNLTSKELRQAHNLEKMYKAGVFQEYENVE